MFQPKIKFFFLIIICLQISCATGESPQIEAENLHESSLKEFDRQNKNVVNSIFNDNQKKNDEVEIELPFQTKSRRRRIEFPEDCTDSIPAGKTNWQLQTACANTIKSVLADLPKNTNLGLSLSKTDCDYNNLQDKNDWLNNYGAKFYQLSSNKYLVEILCIAGAYNQINTYLLYDESAIPAKAEVLEFPSYEITHDEDSNTAKTIKKVMTKTVGGVDFNLKTKKLIVFIKAHGIGDAGEYARYSFPNDKPKLEEFRARFVWSGHGYGTNEVIKSPPKTWNRYYP